MEYLSDVSDGVLISRYKASRDENAAKALVGRYNDYILGRLRRVFSAADAEDVAQQFWVRFFTNTINTYKDTGRFKNYVASSVSNGKLEHKRNLGIRESRVKLAGDIVEDKSYADTLGCGDASAEQQVMSDLMIDFLVNEAVPALPVDQRTAWLLHNESEFYEPRLRLSWETLAQLNAITVEQAWERFQSARDKLISGHQGQSKVSIDPEEFLIFIVWTHAHRPDRKQSYSTEYFAQLLGVPLSTLKTRYYTAEKNLGIALERYLAGDGE